MLVESRKNLIIALLGGKLWKIIKLFLSDMTQAFAWDFFSLIKMFYFFVENIANSSFKFHQILLFLKYISCLHDNANFLIKSSFYFWLIFLVMMFPSTWNDFWRIKKVLSNEHSNISMRRWRLCTNPISFQIDNPLRWEHFFLFIIFQFIYFYFIFFLTNTHKNNLSAFSLYFDISSGEKCGEKK